MEIHPDEITKIKESPLVRFLNAFEGRTPQGILEKHYTDYSPEVLRKQYNILESYLTLDKLI